MDNLGNLSMSMLSEREKMLKHYLSYKFAAIDLNLYLDTHPTDKRALEMYADVVKKMKIARAEFEEKYGPITADESVHDPNKWRWIEDPWPWDNI